MLRGPRRSQRDGGGLFAGARARSDTPRGTALGTTTAKLLKLGDWLRQAGGTHVAMEATGVYWKPVWHMLEGESNYFWRTRRTFVTCPAAKAISMMRPGLQTFWRT